jgi:hypothetical protein
MALLARLVSLEEGPAQRERGLLLERLMVRLN